MLTFPLQTEIDGEEDQHDEELEESLSSTNVWDRW